MMKTWETGQRRSSLKIKPASYPALEVADILFGKVGAGGNAWLNNASMVPKPSSDNVKSISSESTKYYHCKEEG